MTLVIYFQYPVEITSDLDEVEYPETQDFHTTNPNRNKALKTPQLQNARRQETRPKKRNNISRRQRLSNRKTATKLRKIKESDNPVRVSEDRFRTKSNPKLADTVSSMRYPKNMMSYLTINFFAFISINLTIH
jgi:hypothetical protein